MVIPGVPHHMTVSHLKVTGKKSEMDCKPTPTKKPSLPGMSKPVKKAKPKLRNYNIRDDGWLQFISDVWVLFWYLLHVRNDQRGFLAIEKNKLCIYHKWSCYAF